MGEKNGRGYRRGPMLERPGAVAVVSTDRTMYPQCASGLNRVNRGDLAEAEALLMAQAVTLNAMFRCTPPAALDKSKCTAAKVQRHTVSTNGRQKVGAAVLFSADTRAHQSVGRHQAMRSSPLRREPLLSLGTVAMDLDVG